MGTSKGLVLQRGNSAFFISRGWVFIDRLFVTFEIIFKRIDQIYGFVKNLFVLTAVHQQRLCAKHFRNFRKDGCASFGNQHVRKCADNRIGSDSGKSVRTSAFHADDKFFAGDWFPLETRRRNQQSCRMICSADSTSFSTSCATRNFTRSSSKDRYRISGHQYYCFHIRVPGQGQLQHSGD